MAAYDVTLDYRTLDARSDAIAAGLAAWGIGRGVRTVVMVRPGPEFFLLMFALFKIGAVPVLVDPGIDRRALRQCLDEAQPQAFVGIPLAHGAAAAGLGEVGHAAGYGRHALGWGGTTLAKIEAAGAGAGSQLADTAPDDGGHPVHQRLHRRAQGRGLPSPPLRRSGRAAAQCLRMQAGGVDPPTFPPFALFDPALGLTSVIPDRWTPPAPAAPTRASCTTPSPASA